MPQLEDGYTRIAHELLEAITRYPFSKRQYKVLLYIIRKTYGYGKKSDDMTVTQIANGTGLGRPHASGALHELVEMHAVLKRDGRYGYVIGINKNYQEWIPYQNGTCTKPVTTPYQNGTNPRPETVHTIDNPPIDNNQEIVRQEPDGPRPRKKTALAKHRDDAKTVLEFLNEKAGRQYQPTDTNLGFIAARLNDGATIKQCKQVIAMMNREWSGNHEMAKYIRPKTLFNATNFDQYVGLLGADLPEEPKRKVV